MIKSYYEADLDQWALFSGDYNKIHFDREYAQTQGLKDKIVHGMLVMLDAKTLYSEILPPGDKSLSFYLKSPVYINGNTVFAFSSKKGNQRLSIVTNNSLCFIANVDDMFVKINKEGVKKPITQALLGAKINSFRKQYSHIIQDWIFLDALIFSLYITENDANPLAKETANFLKENNISKPDDVVVYQADHRINITQDFWQRRGLIFRNLFYNTRGGQLIRSGNDIYGTVEYNVFEEDKIIYQLSMGLIVKVKS